MRRYAQPEWGVTRLVVRWGGVGRTHNGVHAPRGGNGHTTVHRGAARKPCAVAVTSKRRRSCYQQPQTNHAGVAGRPRRYNVVDNEPG